MKALRAGAAALLSLSLSAAALAQDAGAVPAAAAEIALPDLAVPNGKLADPHKYFLFHKPGVTVAQAEADFGFCWRFLAQAAPRGVPSFVPWGGPIPAGPPQSYDNSSGLVGAVILSIIAGPLARSVRQTRMFRCMVPRGYARYRTSEAVWKQLNSDDALASIRLQARIAAGPVPPTPRIEP